jgi:Rrf2 family nitric oxide-sensitive transcriptional repressor
LIDCQGIDCRLSSACTLSGALYRAQRAFFDTLSAYTLADLIADRSMVKELTADQ